MTGTVRRYANRDAEAGFTLIELLVVVLILGILMAIAIPTFLSLTGGARTNAAEADLTTASQDESVYFTQTGSFGTDTAANITAMQSADSGINWATSPASGGTKTIGVSVFPYAPELAEYCSYNSNIPLCQLHPPQTQQILVLETTGTDGNYYWIGDIGGTFAYAESKSVNGIYGSGFPSPTDFVLSWKQLPSTVATS